MGGGSGHPIIDLIRDKTQTQSQTKVTSYTKVNCSVMVMQHSVNEAALRMRDEKVGLHIHASLEVQFKHLHILYYYHIIL